MKLLLTFLFGISVNSFYCKSGDNSSYRSHSLKQTDSTIRYMYMKNVYEFKYKENIDSLSINYSLSDTVTEAITFEYLFLNHKNILL